MAPPVGVRGRRRRRCLEAADMTARRRATVAICTTALAVGASYAAACADRPRIGWCRHAAVRGDVHQGRRTDCLQRVRLLSSTRRRRAVFPAHLRRRQAPRRGDRRGDARPRDAALEAGTRLRAVRRRAAADRRADRDASSLVRRWRGRRRSGSAARAAEMERRLGARRTRSRAANAFLHAAGHRRGRLSKLRPADRHEPDAIRQGVAVSRRAMRTSSIMRRCSSIPPDRRAGSMRRIRSPATKG